MDLVDAWSTLTGGRSSCRDFADLPVSDRDVNRLLAETGPRPGGDWSYPSAHDRRVVRASRVPDSVDRRRLAAAAFDDQPWLVAAPVVLAVTVGVGELDAMIEEFRDQDPGGLRGRDFTMIEAGAAVQSILLHAVALGLATVVVGGVRQAAVRRVLDTDRHVVALVAVGYAATS